MRDLQDYIQASLPPIEKELAHRVAAMNPVVVPVAEHILQAGGKRLRPILCLLTAQTLGRIDDSIYPLACSLELIHSATLLHDDVLDNAERRRGRRAAHLHFGVTETILAGDALLALANSIITGYRNIELMTLVSEAIYQTATGEILEIQRMRQPVLTREQYLEIIVGKTAFLIQTCCQCGALWSGASRDLLDQARSFGLNLGIAFQLVDDALDYAAMESSTGKPLGGDLREGKLTLPLIFFLQGLDEGHKRTILEKIKDKSLSPEEHEWIMSEIQAGKLAEKTRDEADSYLHKATEALRGFPRTRHLGLLEETIAYIRDRTS
jgi:octaprenyl-diphosphate synthase